MTALDPNVSGRRWAIGGLFIGMTAAVMGLAPAQWLAVAVAWSSQQRVALLNPSGSIWNGSAQLALVQPDQAPAPALALPGLVHWQLRPAWLGLRLRLWAPCCNPEGPQPALELSALGSATGWKWQASSEHSRWPARWLSGLGSPWNTLEPGGTLGLSGQMAWFAHEGRWRTEGQARIDWHDAASALSTLRPLGSYRLQVHGGLQTELRLSTLNGPLELNGQGQWVGDKLRFSGTAQTSPELQGALGSLLGLIGQRKGPVAQISIG